MSGPDIDCGDAILGGARNFPVKEPDTYGLDDATRVGDGIGCESESAAASRAGTSAGTSTGAGLAATGASDTAGLAALAIGCMLLGTAAVRSQFGRRWYATSDPNVRYTIDRTHTRRS